MNDIKGGIPCQLKEKCKQYVAYSTATDTSLLFSFEMFMGTLASLKKRSLCALLNSYSVDTPQKQI
jgi:hypothetical protein